MLDSKKIQEWIETINTYYAFALLVYAVALFVSSQSQFFLWVFVIGTLLLIGWGGYLLHAFLDQRNNRHGFRVISDIMTYEINSNRHNILRYETKIKAASNHVLIYPKVYQWTGQGPESTPKIQGKGQQLLTLLKRGKPSPYKATLSTQGDWHVWFIALNPPAQKGDELVIKYSQEFHDKKGTAKPYLYYFVRTPMKSLELNVKFPANHKPKSVMSSFIKPSDPSRPYSQPNGVKYEPNKQWATWFIEKPKKGYCYRLHWQ